MKRENNPSDKRKSESESPQSDRLIHIRISRRGCWLLGISLALPYLLALGITVSRVDRKPGQNVETNATAISTNTSFNGGNYIPTKPGPWGELEYVPMSIEIPEEFLSLRADEKQDRRWFFSGAAPGQLGEFLDAAGLTANQKKDLLDRSRWIVSTNGIYVTPSSETIFSLESPARQKIYDVLSQFRENVAHQEAFTFVADEFDAFFKDSGLKPETISLVRKLCYPHGKLLRFADLGWLLDTLPTYPEKLKLEKAVSRRATLFVKLRITPQSDVNALMSYWARAGLTKDLRPLLESLAKVPGGVRLNISFLMPDVAGSRLYTYPFPSLNQPENCHWTSFNFFKEQPEINYIDERVVKQKLDADYFPVFSDPRYGDLVFLVKQNGDIIHSCVFLADDIVYTKNGGHFTAPWMLAKIPDLVETYSAYIPSDQKLTVAYYRNKYF